MKTHHYRNVELKYPKEIAELLEMVKAFSIENGIRLFEKC